MSMHTFANMVMAKTPEEKEAAQKAHYEAVANEPNDTEILNEFLSQCEIDE